MVIAVGIDSVEIERFNEWYTYCQKSLERIFSAEEIAYCLSCPAKSAERFAARFALREALFKALQTALPEHNIPFLTLCKKVIIKKSAHGIPAISLIEFHYYQNLSIKASWTHTKMIATAIVLLENT